MEPEPHTEKPPTPPKPRPQTYVYAYGQALPCLETMDEVAAKLEEAEPGAFVELTVGVQQPEMHNHGPGGGFFELFSVNMRDGYTRARYRESVITGYIELLPPPAE